MRVIDGFLVMIMTTIPVNASTNEQAFDNAITNYQAEYLLNADIQVAQGNKVIYHKKVGFADIDTKEPFTDDTLFPIASLSKQFIATAILLLKDDGKLELNKSISDYLPTAHPIWQGKAPKWAESITIHHLLTHSSGLPNFTEYTWPGLEKVADENFAATILTKLKDKKLEYKSGTKAEYNNTGYLILGAIIEELSPEKDLAIFLYNRIFKPANMNHSFLPSIFEQWQMILQPNHNNLVMRYSADIENTKAKPIKIDQITYNPPLVFRIPPVGAGAIISTMGELLKWQEALYVGKILSADSLKAMTTGYIKVDESLDVSGEDQYGYGLIIGKVNGQTLYRHGGWLLGIRTDLSYNPSNQISVIMLSNLSPADNQWKSTTFRQVGSFTELAVRLQEIVNNR